jgi:hypothetical protein
MESLLHFPVQKQVLSMYDANWDLKYTSLSASPVELEILVFRSMLAFYVDLPGLLHWISKQQTFTAGSSDEAEIYATLIIKPVSTGQSAVLKIQ